VSTEKKEEKRERDGRVRERERFAFNHGRKSLPLPLTPLSTTYSFCSKPLWQQRVLTEKKKGGREGERERAGASERETLGERERSPPYREL
jgi:hypothetical protein